MKSWQTKAPAYEGDESYLYFAFAEADSAKVWKILRPLLSRGCRVWYSWGSAGNAKELIRRQTRSEGAALTVLYLTDAACADKDTKSNVLVNQKLGRSILVLDPDGVDRRLSMGLREDVPHIPLYQMQSAEEMESAIIHADGFSQEMIGESVSIGQNNLLEKLTKVFCLLAVLLALGSFVGFQHFHWFQPELRDEVSFTDPAILSAVRDAAHGGAVTEALISQIVTLRLEDLPVSWEELSQLPALETIELPQQAAMRAENLPEGYTFVLSGGDAS